MDAELKKVMSTTVLMNNTTPSVSGPQLSAMSKFERAMMIERMKELRAADRKYRTEAAEAELERRRKMAPGVASAIPALRAIEARAKAANEARKAAAATAATGGAGTSTSAKPTKKKASVDGYELGQFFMMEASRGKNEDDDEDYDYSIDLGDYLEHPETPIKDAMKYFGATRPAIIKALKEFAKENDVTTDSYYFSGLGKWMKSKGLL